MFKETESELFKKNVIKFLKAISLRDILLISGLSSLGYGLYLYLPWVSYTICGLIVLAGGFITKEN